MNRFRKAWLALTGKLEPEIVEVVKEKEVAILGTPEPVTLYAVVREQYGYGGVFDRTEAVYHTCEQAHAEHPGRVVKAKQFWRIGRTYLSGLQVSLVEVQPKPKRAKGKRG